MTTPGSPPGKGQQRGQLEKLVREFQSRLTNDEWEKYHECLSHFMIGRVSRAELVSTISPILKDGLMAYHNKFLLLNYANSLLDHPVEYLSELASFWNKRNAKAKNVRSSQYEKFKQNIMGLPLKERRRIRNITRDSGRRSKINASITLTRHALLPKIPMIQDKDQQQLQVNNLVSWQQDVVNGINAPLARDCYELPDPDNLLRRVLMAMREHGLTGGVGTATLDMISLGLEAHLKNILENAIDVSRYRERKYNSADFLTDETINDDKKRRRLLDVTSSASTKKLTVVLNVEDMYNTFEMFPHLIEPNGSRYRLSNVMLENDDLAAVPLLPYKLPLRRPDPPPESTVANGSAKSEHDDVKPAPSAPPSSSSHIGSTDELKWVLHDLISAM